MLAEYSIHPWDVKNYTRSQLRAMASWLQEREGGDS